MDHFLPSMTSKHFWQESPTSKLCLLPSFKRSCYRILSLDVIHLAQYRLEKELREEVIKYETCRTLFGVDLVNMSLSANCTWNLSFVKNVPVQLAERDILARSTPNTSSLNTFSVQPKYIIAADGANSLVRRSIGVRMDGSENLQNIINVHFKCPGLRELLPFRSSMLYFVFNEVGVFCL